MTQKLCVRIGDHNIWIRVSSQEFASFIRTFFSVSCELQAIPAPCHLLVDIEGGYGEPFVDFTVSVSKYNNHVVYRRKDYRIEIDSTYRGARVCVHDMFALKHALMNLYSIFIVSHNWGLLVHSSCVINHGIAHLFAGRSGAGKSTVARLSQPRMLLSDEASIVRIGDDGVRVFDSPFRSDSVPGDSCGGFPLSSINLLHQSKTVRRDPLPSSDALLSILDKVFYWPVSASDTTKIIRLVQRLVRQVPAFRLYFAKSPCFWEAIS